MSRKTTAKHTAKKSIPASPSSPPQPSLALPGIASLPPITGATASALQLASLAAGADIDDSLLRRRATDLNPATGAPWIPSPIDSRWPIIETLVGLWAYDRARAAAADPLPRICASIKDAAHKWPVAEANLRHFHAKGLAPKAFGTGSGSSRVDMPELIRAMDQLIGKIITGNPAALHDVPGFEQLSKENEQAKQSRSMTALNNIEIGEKTKILHTRDGIERHLGEPLGQIATALKNFPKTTGPKIRAILLADGRPAPLIEQVLEVAYSAISEPLAALHAQVTDCDRANIPNEEKTIWLGKFENITTNK